MQELELSLKNCISLTKSYFTAFQGNKGKMTSHPTETVGELLEDKMLGCWLWCIVYHTRILILKCFARKQRTPGEDFSLFSSQVLMDFPLFPPAALLISLFRLCNEARDWDKLGAFTPGTLCNCVLELWFAAQELQDLSFKASWDMPSC